MVAVECVDRAKLIAWDVPDERVLAADAILTHVTCLELCCAGEHRLVEQLDLADAA